MKNRRHFFGVAWALLLLVGIGCGPLKAEPWSFGVIADTQWTSPDDGQSPHTVPAGIIRQINEAFIAKGVKLVVAVGDMVDRASKESLDTRALYAQELYNAGIGFYPLRGNHDAGMVDSGIEFARIYPQIGTGLNNNTPADIDPAVGQDTGIKPVAKSGSSFVVGINFSAPKEVNEANKSVSYAFDFNNARFILLDQFDNTGNTSNSTIFQQQPWIANIPSYPKRPQQTFVFSHKGLVGGGHKDNLYGPPVSGDQQALRDWEEKVDGFVKELDTRGVRYLICGHDHYHCDSMVKRLFEPSGHPHPIPIPGVEVIAHDVSPRRGFIHQIISASDSSKFYAPLASTPDYEQPVSVELGRIGYYIYTVDGPCVTVDYYGVDIRNEAAGWKGDARNSGCGVITTTPKLTGNWEKRLTFGYSLNGIERVVPQGCSYTSVRDGSRQAPDETGYVGTRMSILSGTNGDPTAAPNGKPLTKAVNTGWQPRTDSTLSDILRLWGMNALGTGEKTDTYALSLSFSPAGLNLQGGSVYIASKDAKGRWVNAVTLNTGGTPRWHARAYDPAQDTLGDYGVDPATHTAWAVVNHADEFAVVKGKTTLP